MGQLMQLNILIFEFFYPYVHKAIVIICCKIINVLGRSTVQPFDQSMVSYRVRAGFSGLSILVLKFSIDGSASASLYRLCCSA